MEHVRDLLTEAVHQTLHPASIELCSCHQTGALAHMQISDDDPLRSALLASRDGFQVPEVSGEASANEILSPALQALQREKVVLAVPLISQGEMVGVLNLGRRLSRQPYSLDDRRFLTTLAAQAAPALRIAQLALQQKEDALAHQRMEQEMRIASIIQHTFLPREELPIPGWKVESYYAPARAVGGDFYDYFLLEDGRLGIVAGDVTDKGVPAALVMTATRTLMRSIALQGLSPGEVLARANNLLDADIPEKMFVTCLYLLIEPNTGRVQFANAGHNLPYVRRGDQVMELRATGMPLGLMPGFFYEEGQAQLLPGDCVLLYSDGLVEAHNSGGEMYGYPRLKEALAIFPEPAKIIEKLLESFSAFTGQSWEQEDDVTLLSVYIDPFRSLPPAPAVDDLAHTMPAYLNNPTTS
jgi:serine phosphatase RsbU (regulator of sigma subunit)